MSPSIRDWDFPGTDRFEVVRLLGEGGMGVVYEAIDRETNGRVALKELRATSPDALLRFKREFRALHDIQHPNLVNLGELIEDSGRWFLTMELVRGASFVEYVRGRGSSGDEAESAAGETVAESAGQAFDETRLRAALAQLVRGLHAVHLAGKIHRDVKPTNVLVAATGHVTLLDFGLVLDAEASHPGGDSSVLGTAAYVAPEQAADEQVGPEADWYSVGVMLYESLVGSPPFTGSPLQILLDKQQREPAAPAEIAPDTPADLSDLCMALLDHNPQSRPTAAELLRRLGCAEAPELAASSRHSLATQSAPFVGRESELDLLHNAYRDCREGRAVAVFVDGVSGVGKSALVHRFVERLAEEEDVVVLAGRCYERENVPYKALDGVVDALSRYMQRLPPKEAARLVPAEAALLRAAFPVLRRVEVLAAPRQAAVVDLQELRSRAFVALRELLALLAATRPVILSVDDLQWADVDSMTLLREIVRPPDAPPLLIIAASRPRAEWQKTTRASLADLPLEMRRIQLQPLRAEEAYRLARALLRLATGAPSEGDEVAQAIASEAAGHPLFIDELVRHAALGTGGRTVGDDGRGAPRLEAALWQRILSMDSMARKLLELVSIAGAPIAQQAAAGALDMSLAELARHASLLRVTNLARTTGARARDLIETYHDRVRTTVLEQIDDEAARAYHAALVKGLEACAETDHEALAVHCRAAGQSAKAAIHAAAAAEKSSQALAFDRAAQLYRTALELCAPDAAHELRVRLGDTLAAAGRGAEAAESYLAAVDDADAAEALDLQRRAVQQLLVTGHTHDGLATLRAVLRSQGMRYPTTSRSALLSVIASRIKLRLRGRRFRVRAATQIPASKLARIDVCWHAGVGLSVVDTIRGNAFHCRGFLLALRAGEPYRLARALALEAGFQCTRGGPGRRETDRLLEQAGEIARELDDAHAIALVTGVRGTARFLRGEFREGLAFSDEAEVILRNRCSGVSWELGSARLFAARSLFHLGELGELARRVPKSIQESRDRGDLYGETTLRATVLPFLLLAQDEPAEAARIAHESLDRWPSHGFQIQHYYQINSHSSADLYAGRPTRVVERMAHAWSDIGRSLILRVQFIRLSLFDLRARSLLAAAQATTADDTRQRYLGEAERDRRRVAREKMAWSNPLAELIGACAAQTRGDQDAALAGFTAAAEGFDAAEMAMHAAVARRRRGELLGGDEGAGLVRESDAMLTEQEIVSPARTARMLAPVREESGEGIG